MGMFDFLSDPLVSLGSNIFNGIMGASSQAATNAQNAALSREQMDFQERMSSTAHQREVSDLISAGLNPILSASRGASTPGGSLAVMQSPYQAGVNAAEGGSRVRLNTASSAKTSAETEVVETEALQARWIAGNIDKVMEAKISMMLHHADITQWQAATARVGWDKAKVELANLAKSGELTDAETAKVKAETILRKFEMPEASAFASFFATELGKKVPYIREVEHAASSAAGVAIGRRLFGK